MTGLRLESLRMRAEALLAEQADREADAAVHELRVHQAELELQNDELRRLQAEVESRVALLRAVVDTVGDAVVACDAEGRVVLANHAARALFGGDPVGREADSLFAEQGVLAQRRVAADLTAMRSDGATVPVSARFGTAVVDGAPQMVVFVVDRAVVGRIQEHEARTQRMDAVGRVAGGVAHDLRNLLMGIRGLCEPLADQSLDADGVAALEHVQHATDRGADMVEDLLSMSDRPAVRALEPVDLGAIVRGSTPMFRQLLGARVELDVVMRGGPMVVVGSPSLLERALLNLIVNARDAMPFGGSASVLLDVVSAAELQRRGLPCETDADHVVVRVSDSGLGMDDATRQRAFEPFFTGKGGTGLGLATVYATLRQLGGVVDVESELGKGTTFTLAIPRWSDPSG